MDDIKSVFFGCVRRGESVRIYPRPLGLNLLLEGDPNIFICPLSTNVKQDSLLVGIFEVRVGSVIYQQFHDLIGLFVIDKDGLRSRGRAVEFVFFQMIDNNGVVLFEILVYFVECAAFVPFYQHLMAIMKSLTAS